LLCSLKRRYWLNRATKTGNVKVCISVVYWARAKNKIRLHCGTSSGLNYLKYIVFYWAIGFYSNVCVLCFVTDEFDEEVVRNQVNNMGLVEMLRIRKAGFAYRGKFEEFLNRYKSLCPDTWPDWKRRHGTAVDAVVQLIQHMGYTDKDFKIGKYAGKSRIIIIQIRFMCLTFN